MNAAELSTRVSSPAAQLATLEETYELAEHMPNAKVVAPGLVQSYWPAAKEQERYVLTAWYHGDTYVKAVTLGTFYTARCVRHAADQTVAAWKAMNEGVEA